MDRHEDSQDHTKESKCPKEQAQTLILSDECISKLVACTSCCKDVQTTVIECQAACAAYLDCKKVGL